MPSPYYQEKLCLLFGKNAEELGFLKTKPRTNTFPVNTPTTQNTEILPLLTHAISQGIIAATTELGEKQDMDKWRRELMELALGLTGSVVFSPLSASIATEDFLAQCAASIKGCWYLMRGKGLAIAEEILSTTLPALVKLAVQPSKNQRQAARIATEACMIRAIIAKHRLNFALREISCKEAVQFSHYTLDSTLQAAALMYLGYTYQDAFNIYQRTPDKWRSERQIQALAHDGFFRLSEGRNS